MVGKFHGKIPFNFENFEYLIVVHKEFADRKTRRDKATASMAGAFTSAGSAIGSVIPVVGTAVGAVVGGAIGWTTDWLNSGKGRSPSKNILARQIRALFDEAGFAHVGTQGEHAHGFLQHIPAELAHNVIWTVRKNIMESLSGGGGFEALRHGDKDLRHLFQAWEYIEMWSHKKSNKEVKVLAGFNYIGNDPRLIRVSESPITPPMSKGKGGISLPPGTLKKALGAPPAEELVTEARESQPVKNNTLIIVAIAIALALAVFAGRIGD